MSAGSSALSHAEREAQLKVTRAAEEADAAGAAELAARRSKNDHERVGFADDLFTSSAFDQDDEDYDDDEEFSEDERAVPGVGIPPRMPSGGLPASIVAEQQRLREAAAQHAENDSAEARGWGLMKELCEIVSAAVDDANTKRVSPKQLEQFLEDSPITERYAWMVPPREPQGEISVSKTDMGQMARHFEAGDFHYAATEMTPRVIESLRVSQKPVKRCEVILAKYGVKIRGLSSFKLVVQCLALCLAKESRISNGAASPTRVRPQGTGAAPPPEATGRLQEHDSDL